MKKIIIPIIILLLGCKNDDTISIDGHITGELPKKIFLARPIEGHWFLSPRDTVTIDSMGNFKITVDTKVPSFVSLFAPKMDGVLLVEPGNDYHLQIDMDSKNSFRVSGAADTLQSIYNSFELPVMGYVSSPMMRSIRKDSVPERIAMKLDSAFQMNKDLFDSLLKDRLISKEAHQLAVADRQCYYIGMGALICNMQLYQDPDTQQPLFKYWSSLYETLPVTSKDYLRSPYAFPYLKSYIAFKGMETGNFDMKKLKERHDQGTIHRYRIGEAKKYLQGKRLEYYFATYLVDNGFNNKDNSEELITLYADFKDAYPNSNYTPLITQAIEPIIVFRKQLAKDSVNPNVKLVTDFQDIDTLKDLFSPFKGKKLFVDIWGTWCAPCKEEFAYKASLDSLLNTYAIEPLYICEGRLSKEKTWKEMINFYELKGYHVFANRKLVADITKSLGKNGSFGYPRYLLVDENGKVTVPRANAPSKMKELEKDIQSVFE